MRETTLKTELKSIEDLIAYWRGLADSGELPFTDSEVDIDPQDTVKDKLVADLAIAARKCEALVEVITGAHLG